MTGRVFIVQAPAKRDGATWVEKYDLTPAMEHGQPVRCLPYGNVPLDPTPTRAALLEALKDFDAKSDFLLLLGDPVAMAQAVFILTEWYACFYALKFDRRANKYQPYLIGNPEELNANSQG